MAEDDNSGESTHGTLKMVAEICLDAQRYIDEAKRRGEECTFTDGFERALATREFSERELLSIWSLFTLGGRTTKRLLREMAREQWDSPHMDMGSQPNAH